MLLLILQALSEVPFCKFLQCQLGNNDFYVWSPLFYLFLDQYSKIASLTPPPPISANPDQSALGYTDSFALVSLGSGSSRCR